MISLHTEYTVQATAPLSHQNPETIEPKAATPSAGHGDVQRKAASDVAQVTKRMNASRCKNVSRKPA
jgi:hypothetical protein